MIFISPESNSNWLIDSRILKDEFILNFVFREFNQLFPMCDLQNKSYKIQMREDYPETRYRRIITLDDYKHNDISIPDYHIFLLGDTSFWCRTIYQFSHEMCHVVMGCCPQKQKFKWIAECFAGAASFFMLSKSIDFFIQIGKNTYSLHAKEYTDKAIKKALYSFNDSIESFCQINLESLEQDEYGYIDGERSRNNYISAHLYHIILGNLEGWSSISLFATEKLAECQTLDDYIITWSELCRNTMERDFVNAVSICFGVESFQYEFA